MIEIRPTALADVIEVIPAQIDDARGWFRETWSRKTFTEAGVEIDWVQDNESLSLVSHTLRGIHFQRAPFAQDKLFRVLSGEVLDLAIDLRRSSPSFGQHVLVELSARQGNQLLIPKGFGHAFVTLSPRCHVAYKVSAPYDRTSEVSIQALDASLGIDWRLDPSKLVVSDKDRAAPLLSDASELLFD